MLPCLADLGFLYHNCLLHQIIEPHEAFSFLRGQDTILPLQTQEPRSRPLPSSPALRLRRPPRSSFPRPGLIHSPPLSESGIQAPALLPQTQRYAQQPSSLILESSPVTLPLGSCSPKPSSLRTRRLPPPSPFRFMHPLRLPSLDTRVLPSISCSDPGVFFSILPQTLRSSPALLPQSQASSLSLFLQTPESSSAPSFRLRKERLSQSPTCTQHSPRLP